MKYRFHFDKEKCTGCYACHAACIDAHHADVREPAKSFRTIQKVVCAEEGFQKNICPGCIHCGKCLDACRFQAICREEETGFVLSVKEKCTGCRECQKVCPMGVISFGGDGKMEKCDGCTERIKEGRLPACVHTCCGNAITLERIE